MEKWMVAAKKADFDAIANKYGISPVLARIIRNRDVMEDSDIAFFLHGTLEDCHEPYLMKDMEKAVAVMEASIRQGKRIRVIGDYDVDGICAAHILRYGLEMLGADVNAVIPHRIKDGYGLNDALIYQAKDEGMELVITCDNGIAACEQIALAKSLGMDVIVTDHHEVPYEIDKEGVRKEILPPADAVVDPKREDCTYPFSGICGAVVAYKFIQALAIKMDMEKAKMLAKELLPFAAMATICDVMELKDENRVIVREGLAYVPKMDNEGLKSLAQVNGLDMTALSGYHMGFVMGPCLNASGRLDTAARALELFATKDKGKAVLLATQLKELNDSRKALTVKGVEDALKQIEEQDMAKDDVMVVYLPDVHESLAGIIAGRIREAYNHPVFVLTKAEEGLKGSGRSIDNYHMYEALCEVKEHLTKFGGHKLAAGLSLEEDKLMAFREALLEHSKLTEEDFVKVVHIDVPMPMSYGSLAFAKELEKLEPYGVGNPKPLFAQKDVHFVGAKRIGANGNYAKFTVLATPGSPKRDEVMFFGDVEEFCRVVDEKHGEGSAEKLFAGRGDVEMSVVYQVGINTFRGNQSVQYIMVSYM